MLQALLADLLERCGTEPRGEVPAAELRERYRLTHEASSQEQINLLNLVNFGGGCYAVYAEIQEATSSASTRSCTARSSAGPRACRRWRRRRS